MGGIGDTMPEIYSVALSGVQRGEQRLEKAARRIAQPTAGQDTVRISSTARDMVSIKEAELAVKSNLKLIKAQIELDKAILDLLA
jgi:hypothetical protein